MARVTLHIGAHKTGTSFIQSGLSANTEKLAKAGVLWPSWGVQVEAARELRRSSQPGRHWRKLAQEIDGWTGGAGIISVEGLSRLRPRAIPTVLDSLSQHDLRVVLTVRDLARIIPSQWQNWTKLRNPWSYNDFLDGIMNANSSSAIHAQFWRRHDYAAILKRWSRNRPGEALSVVTVPQSGAPHATLWERFCAVAELDANAYQNDRLANVSLGPYSAEFMRQLMQHIEALQFDDSTRMALRRKLANAVLPLHRNDEPTLIVPERVHAWVMQRSEEMISDISDLGVHVTGDLEDLRPVLRSPSDRTTHNPSDATPDELMEIAALVVFEMMKESVINSDG